MARTALTGFTGALLAFCAASAADTILNVHGGSLTTIKFLNPTPGQDVRPSNRQRGVNMDGTLRAGSAYRWAFIGNPFETAAAGSRLGDIDLAIGAYSPTHVDLALPAPGASGVVIGRIHNHGQEKWVTSAFQHHDSAGYQGYNWFQIAQPELQFYDDGDNTKDMLYVVYGPDRVLEFKRTGSSGSDPFQGVNGTAGVIVENTMTTPPTYEWSDQHGVKTYFFGDDPMNNGADWQFWKVVDPAGNAAYVGDVSDPSVAEGSYTSQRVIDLFDGAGRRYHFTYTSNKLTTVLVETDAGGGWGTPGTEDFVAGVEYTYYGAMETHGSQYDLKTATVTVPLGEGEPNWVRTRYYRYWVGTYDPEPEEEENPPILGNSHELKLVLDFENVRRYQADHSFDDSYKTTASDDDLKPYATAYLEYVSSSDHRVAKGFFNGECGCGGGTNGEYNLSYGAGSNYTTTIANTSYDNGANDWARVVVEQPDGTWFTQYFDETGQATSRVITDANPSGAYTDMWATQVVRDGTGRIIQMHSPAANDTYTHSSGALASKSTDGLITLLTRVSGGDYDGLQEYVKHKKGTSGTEYYDAKTEYTERELNITGSIDVTRPLISARRAYHTEGTSSSSNYDETTMSYAWWEVSTATDPLYVTLKSATTTAPAISTGKHGSGSGVTTARYLRPDGTVAFSQSGRGVCTYTAFSNGQLTTLIEDAKTNTGTSYPSGEHPSTNFAIPQDSTGFHRETSYAYDVVGRPYTTTHPDGRTSLQYYAQMADTRLITLSIPRFVDADIATYGGPAGLNISNMTGNTEECIVLGIQGGETDTALPYWVSLAVETFTPFDEISDFEHGDFHLARRTSTTYNNSGLRRESVAAYYDIGNDDADVTTYAYDDMNRVIRVEDSTHTLTRSYYDDLGRVTSRKIGTDDSGEPGGSGSSNNMVKTEELEYDGGADGGNNLLTERTLDPDGNWGTTTDQRVTSYIYDYRNRLIVTDNPVGPDTVALPDNLGRTVAVGIYSTASGFTAATDPTSTSTNRVGLSETFFDERGQVYETRRYEIDQSDGSIVQVAMADEYLPTFTWYDPDGTPIETEGEQFTKTRFDRLGRVIQTFVLATKNDGATTYADVYDSTNKFADVDGDKVLLETQYGHAADSDEVLMTTVISRDYGDTSTTGPLDTTYDGGDGDPLAIDAADVAGRAQMTLTWYDEYHRPTTVAVYGTNTTTDNVDDLAWWDPDAPMADPLPTRSDDILISSTTYDDDGSVLKTTDPKGIVTRFAYDDRGRLTKTIANYDDGSPSGATGDDDVHTRYEYANGLQTTMWVDLDGDNVKDTDDQVTTYIYGSNAAAPTPMKITTLNLLRAVIYPDSTNTGADVDDIDSDSSDVMSYAYNALGEVVYTKDQAGNIIETEYDLAGRETARKATTIQSGYDSAVQRIATAYDARGMVDTITQYDDDSAGNVTDQLQYEYDDWGNLSAFVQDMDSSIGGMSGRDDFEVSYTYDKTTAGRRTLRRGTETLPGARVVSYEYSSSGGKLDNAASRVTTLGVTVGAGADVPVVQYQYLGLSQLAGTDMLEPDARWNLYEGAGGSDPYPDLDRFNRIRNGRWTGYKSTPVNFVDTTLSYDRNSNVTLVDDLIHTTTAGGTGNSRLDTLYTMDGLNRLTETSRGNWSGSVINNATRAEHWTLNQTGTQANHIRDLDASGTYGSTGEFNDTRAFNVANELLTRNTDSTGGVEYTQTHNAAGEMTDDGKNYIYIYDVFGRLREVQTRFTLGGFHVPVAEYRYNGLGFKIGWHYDVNSSGFVDGSDPWYYFCYRPTWQIAAVFRAGDSGPKEVYVQNAAGLGGYGGSSYIDSMLLRDRDASTAWTNAADALEERVYYCPSWRSDVAALLSAGGKMLETQRYLSYGSPDGSPAGDYDDDGDWDATDSGNITGSYDVRKDTELDGDVDANDVTHANSITGSYQTLGYEKLSSSALFNRYGYAGAEHAVEVAGSKVHMRMRFYMADIGQISSRDPTGYLDGMNLYAYVNLMPIVATDPDGLHGVSQPSCSSGTCGTPLNPGRLYPPSPSSPPMCAGGTCSSGGVGVRSKKAGPVLCSGAACSIHVPASYYLYNCPGPSPTPTGPQPNPPQPNPPTGPAPSPPGVIKWNDCPQFNNCTSGGVSRIPGKVPTPNGCGSALYQTIPLHIFYPAFIGDFGGCCDNHDNCYQSCGVDKTFCDQNFFWCMMSACKSAYSGWFNKWSLNRWRCEQSAEEFYRAVHKWGKGAFCSAQAANCKCKGAGGGGSGGGMSIQ